MFSEKAVSIANNESSGTSKGPWSKLNSFFLIVFFVVFVQNGSLAVRTVDAFEKQLPAGEANAKFRWVPAGNSHLVQKVTTETKIIIPIEFEVGGNITGVVFVISPKFKAFGIRIENPSSEVKQGIARTRVIFNVASGMPLGRHDLVIQVFERDGKAAIARGTIPFIILPNDMECLC